MSAVPPFSGQFLIASRRTGLAPFGTHPALQKIGQRQAASSIRVEIGGSVSTRGYIAHVDLPARLVSLGVDAASEGSHDVAYPSLATLPTKPTSDSAGDEPIEAREYLPALVQWR